jgi:prepilin-type N-terminal cleavage/methylation domain-containing protein
MSSCFSPVWRSEGGFTLLELMLVIGIIGLMAAMALPHVVGFSKGSAMTAATRQMLDDVALARQRAMANRSMVCMVFLPAEFWVNDRDDRTGGRRQFWTQQITNLAAHQYSAYALISMRTVGDQPGVSNVHYISDWKFLPQGVYIAPFQFTNEQGLSNIVSTTNTLAGQSGLSNGWPVSAFLTNIPFPFPSTYDASFNYGYTVHNYLPYIGFAANGQLTTNADQFIMLTSGSIFASLNSNGLPLIGFPPAPPNVAETPPGNATNNPNLIHIDWLTARARLERNQF